MKKRMFVLTTMLSFAVMTGCTYQAAPESIAAASVLAKQPVKLTDIDKHWAKGSIESAIDQGYVDGYEDATFRPESDVSRAEFIKMTVLALKLQVDKAKLGDSWFTPYVNAAVKLGIHRSDDFATGDYNTQISRIEMSRIAVRATKKELQNPNLHMDDNSFMYNATKTGLIQGLAGGDLGFDKSTTRAQSVTIIGRVLTAKNGGKLPVDKYAVSSAELALKKTNIFSMIPAFWGVQDEGHEWSPEKLVVETPDGLFKGTIDQVVAIDMEDPNDPNRYLLGDINDLHWFNKTENAPKDMPLVKDYPHSYMIFIKRHVDYVKDTVAYSEIGNVGFSIYGFKSPDETAFHEGKLNTLAQVFRNKRGDMGAYIIPKEGAWAPHGIDFTLNVPARPPVDDFTHTITSMQPAQ